MKTKTLFILFFVAICLVTPVFGYGQLIMYNNCQNNINYTCISGNITETDPIWSVAKHDYWNISGVSTAELLTNSSNGQTAYGWGDWSNNATLQQTQITILNNSVEDLWTDKLGLSSLNGYFNSYLNFTGTLTDDDVCMWDSSGNTINCTIDTHDWDTAYGWGDWSNNATLQQTQITILNTSIENLWTNQSSQNTKWGVSNISIENLWTNQSSQNTKWSVSNISIENLWGNITSKRFNATSINTVVGTPSIISVLTDINIADGLTYNITEIAGGSGGIDTRINFTGVTSFDTVLLREKYEGSASHIVYFQLWDYSTLSWENYTSITTQTFFNDILISPIDPSNHILGGVVRLRIRHYPNGIGTHVLYLDYVIAQKGAIVSSTSTASITELYQNASLQQAQINGKLTTSNMWNRSGEKLYPYDISNKVSIGTDTPIATLTVSGSTLVQEFNATNVTLPTMALCKSWEQPYWTNTGKLTCRYIVTQNDMFFTVVATFSPLQGAVISAGTGTAQVGNATHLGIFRFLDSTTINGGYQISVPVNSFSIKGGEYAEFVLKPYVYTSGVGKTRENATIRLGFQDSLTSANPVDGCWINIYNRTWKGRCGNNSIYADTPTNYTLPASNWTWYRGTIEFDSTASSVNFTLYAELGNKLWSNTIQASTTAIPRTATGVGRETGYVMIATEPTANIAVAIVDLDYYAWEIRRTLQR